MHMWVHRKTDEVECILVEEAGFTTGCLISSRSFLKIISCCQSELNGRDSYQGIPWDFVSVELCNNIVQMLQNYLPLSLVS